MGLMRGLEADRYDRQYDDRYLFRRIGAYFGRHKGKVGLVLAAFAVLAVVSALRPVLVAAGVGALEETGRYDTITLIAGVLVVAAFTEYAMNWTRRRLLTVVLGNVVAQMRKDAFEAAVDRDLAFYDENKSGKIVSRITSDTQEFNDVVLVSSDVVSQMVQVVILLVVMLNQSVTLTLVLMTTAPMVILAALSFRRMARYVTRQSARAIAVVNDNIQESVTGISVAKNFRREAMIYDEFVDVNMQSYRINVRRGVVLAMVFPTLSILSGIATAVIVYAGATLAFDGVVSIGAWFLFAQGVDRFWFPFTNLASFWSQFQQGLSATERIFGLIDADNTIQQNDNQPAGDLKGHIEFRDVTFSYKGDQAVLKHFNLDIQPGESVAFVGHTGAGKSTIAKLITRFYEFQEGEICVDGRDIRSFDLQDYRASITWL